MGWFHGVDFTSYQNIMISDWYTSVSSGDNGRYVRGDFEKIFTRTILNLYLFVFFRTLIYFAYLYFPHTK